MKAEDFILKFESIFDDVIPGSLDLSVKFKELEEWNSLMALALIAMVDDEYGLSLSGENIRNSTTLNDLYLLLMSN